MLVKGNSGFGIELVDEVTIRKSGSGRGGDRLKRQIEKQSLFNRQFQHERIRTPNIFRTSASAGVFYADMEFVTAKDFIQFLSEADRAALDDFSTVMLGFISRNLDSSRVVEVSGEIRKKLDELAAKSVPPTYLTAAKRLCNQPITVPVGDCHGDLTLSNILFKGSTFYLIDFLDCYVESPLQDIAKLRQDTQFFWSLQLYQADFNWPRIQIALHYLDRQIEAAFQSFDWYHRHYQLFQFVNFMRLMPYCVENKTRELVIRALDGMLIQLTREVA